jgi:hypothetical protein
MLGLVLLSLLNQVPAAPTPDRMQGWREDLAAIRTTLETKHANAFSYLKREEFASEMADIDGHIADLPDHMIVTRLLRIVSKIRDGHTNLIADPENQGFHRTPAEIRWFRDGWFVTSASKEGMAASGKRLLAVDGMPVEEVVRRLGEIAPYDNPMARIGRIPIFFRTSEFLLDQGIAKRLDKLTLTVQGTTGAEEVVLRPRLASDNIDLVPFVDRSKLLSRRYANKNYAFEHVPEVNAMYIAYNACQFDRDLPMARFVEQVREKAKETGARAFVVDLRLNGGGASIVMNPLTKALAEARLPVYAIIGRSTFSSAVINANDLREKTAAVLVGEPTSGTLNGYREVLRLKLPYSGMTLQYSTKRFDLDPSGRDAIYPDIQIFDPSSDYFANRDRTLETIFAAIRRQ